MPSNESSDRRTVRGRSKDGVVTLWDGDNPHAWIEVEYRDDWWSRKVMADGDEYAEMLQDLAEDWDGDEPAVLIGDVNGNVNITAKDGFTNYASVGFAQECFEGNGVHELSKGDTRFFGTMLFRRERLAEDAQEQLAEADWAPGGDG